MNINTMGSQCVRRILWLNWQNRPEDDWTIAKHVAYVITLCNKVVVLTYLFNIILRLWAHREASVQKINVQNVTVSCGVCSDPLLSFVRKKNLLEWALCVIYFGIHHC